MPGKMCAFCVWKDRDGCKVSVPACEPCTMVPYGSPTRGPLETCCTLVSAH